VSSSDRQFGGQFGGQLRRAVRRAVRRADSCCRTLRS